MKLKSFGCSFIFGTDLADANAESLTASINSWPALLAQQLGHDYTCYARPGAGNLQILEQVLNQATTVNNDLFVVNWTWIDRFDYYNANYDGKSWTDWFTIMPVDTNNLAKTYYRDLHSEYRDKFTSLSYIKLAIDTLEQQSIPFIMTYTDELLFDQKWHTTPAVTALQASIKPKMMLFEGQTFLNWSRNHDYPISAGWHPLEDAHREAALIAFDKQKTNGLTR